MSACSKSNNRLCLTGAALLGLLFLIGANISHAAETQSNENRRIEVWNTVLGEGEMLAADCDNCDEDIAVLIFCKPTSNVYTVHFMWLAQRNAKQGDKTQVLARTADYTGTIDAVLSEPGMLDPYPIALLKSSDGFFTALAKGKKLTLSAGKESTDIPLKGAHRTMASMRGYCGKAR